MAIICATDFSDFARHAEDAAAVLAGRLGQPLWVVHVLEPDVELMSDATRAQVKTMLQERLQNTAGRLMRFSGKSPQVAVLEGRAAEVVQSFAKAHEGRLIVVGSAGHGASALRKLGGTSERLAHGSAVPVLVVREGDTFSEWFDGKPFKVLLGLDDSHAGASALRWIAALRAVAPIDVVVGRVYYASDAHHQYGVAGRRFSYTDPDAVVESLIERDLKRLVPSLPGQGEILYRAKLGLGRVADHLLELAEAERCQMVVVGSHVRTGVARMWSVSAGVLHFARMAVAVVAPDGKGAGALTPAPRLKRVLVATDFSPLGDSAVAWAYTLVEGGGEVILAHVTPPEGVAGQLADLYAPALPAPHASPKVEAEVAARLRALSPPVASERDVVTRTEVVRGADVAQALLALSEQLGVDTVVIASHGRSGISRAMNGSVAEAVLRGSRRPVFVVRPSSE